MQDSICEIVRRNEDRYQTGQTTISKYVSFNMAETINKIDAYLNSKHVSGSVDAQGREKPFFNIVTAATNIWYRATDIDRKNIEIIPTKSGDVIGAMLATIHLQNFMRKDQFGVFLNDWGRALARYGSAVVKFIEKSGELHAAVVPWNRLIVDAVDFDNDVVIEILELTPSQLLQKKGYNKQMVEDLINAKTTRKTSDGQDKDTKDDFIKVYEVHGMLPLSLLTDREKDKNEYVQQMHVVSYVEGEKKGDYDEYTLVSGKEAKHPYMITHLIKEEGRTLSIGAVENLFEAQWMQNHSAKLIKDQLDMASKLIYQTSDGNFIGQNALTAIQNGDILVHADQAPLTQVNNSSHDIVSIQNFAGMWKQLGNEINGISESMMGNNAPSGTAWRQTEALLNESHSLFELMTENKALALEDMLRTHVIPHIKTKMDTSDEIGAVLDAQKLEKIDKLYVPYEATKRLAKKVIADIINKGEFPGVTDDMKSESVSGVKSELEMQGNSRFFKPSDLSDATWKELFKDLEWDLDINISGESKDKQAALTTLNTTLQIIMGKQGMPMSSEEKLVFNKILNLTGEVSPMEMAALATQDAPVVPQAPQMPPQSPLAARPMS